jgi:hypothetical protein
MEMMIKTAEEFHSAHVTIEIRATPEEATEVSQRLFTADEVGHYQATEAELVAAPLRRRIAELERTLAEVKKSREFSRNRVVELAARVAQARSRVSHARIALSTPMVQQAKEQVMGLTLAEAIDNALAALEA